MPRSHEQLGRGAQLRYRAFTLIELLLVIAVIALLISLILPAIGMARRAAAQTRESSAARQLCIAYLSYATDYKGKVLPGYLRTSWCFPTTDPVHYAPVFDSPSALEDNRLEGVIIQRYPYRLLPYMDFQAEGLV